MTDRPIIMSGPMVRALLDGRKTMTRRLAWRRRRTTDGHPNDSLAHSSWMRVRPGDRLWVRETTIRTPAGTDYAATTNRAHYGAGGEIPKTPAIHMPRLASRVTLIVTATKMERLQEISAEDAEAEGVRCDMSSWTFVRHFQDLWERLHGPGSWEANPEVVAISFRVVKANIDRMAT